MMYIYINDADDRNTDSYTQGQTGIKIRETEDTKIKQFLVLTTSRPPLIPRVVKKNLQMSKCHK